MMIIKNKAIVNDDWVVLRLAEDETPESVTVAAVKTIVPLKVWLSQKQILQNRDDIGVWFASDERPEALKDDITKFSVIAVDFPKFTDGRGQSIAYNLRERLAYRGELRAIGEVLRDQVFYMQRVGFDAFAPRPDRDLEDVLKGLTVFSEGYQISVDQKSPLFRRVARTEASSKA